MQSRKEGTGEAGRKWEEEEEEGKVPISGMTEQIEVKQRGSVAILRPQRQ